jgi:hypothetical protein
MNEFTHLFCFVQVANVLAKTARGGGSRNESKSIPEIEFWVPNWYVTQNMTDPGPIAKRSQRVLPKWIGLAA